VMVIVNGRSSGMRFAAVNNNKVQRTVYGILRLSIILNSGSIYRMIVLKGKVVCNSGVMDPGSRRMMGCFLN